MHEEAVGRVHPAVTVGRGLEVDREAVAMRDEQIRAQRLARIEDGAQRGLHVRGLEDLATDDRLRDADALAPASAETVRVERDARRVRAVTADLTGLGLHDDRRLPR